MEKFEDPSPLHAVFFLIIGAYLYLFIQVQQSGGFSLSDPANLLFTPLIFVPFIIQFAAAKMGLRFFAGFFQILEGFFLLPYMLVGIAIAQLASVIFKFGKRRREEIVWIATYAVSITIAFSSIWIGTDASKLILPVAVILSGAILLFYRDKMDNDEADGPASGH